MNLLGLVLTAAVPIDLLAALLLGLAFARRPGEREYLLASLAAATAALHAAAALSTPASRLAPIAGTIASAGLVLALAFAIHFAALYVGDRSLRYLVSAAYVAAAGVAGVELAWTAAERTAHASELGALRFGSGAVLPAPAPLAVQILYAAAAASVLVLAARAYLAGRPGALAIVVGATVLLATALYDLGVAAGAFATVRLIDEGMAILVAGIATTPAARYSQASSDLQLRTSELRTRTRELRASYENLRAAQEELDKKEHLAVVGELAAVIAHEVRNPLAIISNAVAGLRKPAITRSDQDVLLSILDEETSRLDRLVKDLLRYARPINVQRTQIAIEDLIERTLALARTGSKSIRMELEMEASDGHLWADGNLLRLVFDNLIDNAVQAMAASGSLTVRVRTATEGSVGGLAVDVVDTGEGMDTQVRSRALDPFFTTRPSGTGLGLAIVNRIVDAHGGHVSIRSRSGEGTTVTVFLPSGSPNDPTVPAQNRTSGAADASA